MGITTQVIFTHRTAVFTVQKENQDGHLRHSIKLGLPSSTTTAKALIASPDLQSARRGDDALTELA